MKHHATRDQEGEPTRDSLREHAQAARVVTLSPREREAAGLVVQGLTNRDVANAMVLAEQTVKNTLARVFRKLGVRRRVELVCRFGRYLRTQYVRTD